MPHKITTGLVLVMVALGAPLAQALSAEEARHLLHRTGYGVTASDWAKIIDLDYAAAVDLLVDAASMAPAPLAPEWVKEVPLSTVERRGLTEEEQRNLGKKKRALIYALSEWWLQQMLITHTPLRERMTMFWSNHFTTGFRKIAAPMLIYQQHAVLRHHALGSFGELLHEMVEDPALLRYLDNDRNRKGSVNENFARELMELFTLGEGNYTEKDVKEAARCLTGWGVNRRKGEFRRYPHRHDNESKTVLGEFGNFDAHDLMDLLLGRPETAQHIVTKLWREFISLEPDQRLVTEWARNYRASGYATNELLKTMFKSAPFRDPANYGVLIKSPTELYAGLVRPALDGLSEQTKLQRIENSRAAKRLPQLTRGAGQKLFDPPNVKGWPGGLKWIDSQTLLLREQVARNLVLGLSSDEQRGNPYVRSLGSDATAAGHRYSMIWMLTAIDPLTDIPVNYTERRALLAIVRDPVIHLK